MPDFAVTTAFKGADKLSPVYNKMGKSADKFGDRATKSINKVNRAQTALISKTKMYAGIGLGLAAGLITREFVNFDHAITAASAKFPGLSDGSEESRKTLERLRLTARKVGAETQFTATQAGQGLDFLAMASFNAEQAMALLPGVTNLATVANVDLARSTDIASDSLGAFGLMTKDTIQLTKNFTRINDVMAATITRANTNMEDLFESIKKGAPSFTVAGQSLESFNALAGIMANSGLKGAESGTQLRNIMLRLASPTAEASKILNNLGIVTQDADGNFRDIVDILADFEKGTKSMGSAQKSAALATVFGARSVTGVNILLQEGTENIRKFREGLLSASGASQQMADVMRQSLLNRLKTLLSTVIELGFKFIDAFSAQGGSAIDSITQAARSLGPVFSFLGKVISLILPMMPYLIGGFVAYKAALIGVALYQKIMIGMGWIKYLIMMRTHIWKAITMTKAWAVVQKVLNVIMSMNPISLLVIGIAALIGYIALAIKYWDKFGSAMMLLLGPIGMVISAIMMIWKRWEKIKNAFTTGGIVEGLKQIGLAILDAIVYPIQQLLEVLGNIPGVGKYIKKGAEVLQSFREKFLGAEKQKSEIIKKRVETIKKGMGDISRAQESRARTQAPQVTAARAPNEAEARARRIDFRGRIDIAGAPEGTELQSETQGAPSILLQLLGVQ
jgi:TP901 family phage tail tape measure protein